MRNLFCFYALFSIFGFVSLLNVVSSTTSIELTGIKREEFLNLLQNDHFKNTLLNLPTSEISLKRNNVKAQETLTGQGAYNGGVQATAVFSTTFSDSKCSIPSYTYISFVSPCAVSENTFYTLLCTGDDSSSPIWQAYSSSNCSPGTELYWYGTQYSSPTCVRNEYSYIDQYSSPIGSCYSELTSDTAINSALKANGYFGIVQKMYSNSSLPDEGNRKCSSSSLQSLVAFYQEPCTVIENSETYKSYTQTCTATVSITSIHTDDKCSAASLAYVFYDNIDDTCHISPPKSYIQSTCLQPSVKPAYGGITYPNTVQYAYPKGTEKRYYAAFTMYSDKTCSSVSSASFRAAYYTAALNTCVYLSAFGVYEYWAYKGGKLSAFISSKSDCSDEITSLSTVRTNTCTSWQGTYFRAQLVAPGTLGTPTGRTMGALVDTDSKGAVSITYHTLNVPEVLTEYIDSNTTQDTYFKYTCVQGRVIATNYTDSSYSTKHSAFNLNIMGDTAYVCISPSTPYYTTHAHGSTTSAPTHKKNTKTSEIPPGRKRGKVVSQVKATADVYDMKVKMYKKASYGVLHRTFQVDLLHARIKTTRRKIQVKH